MSHPPSMRRWKLASPLLVSGSGMQEEERLPLWTFPNAPARELHGTGAPPGPGTQSHGRSPGGGWTGPGSPGLSHRRARRRAARAPQALHTSLGTGTGQGQALGVRVGLAQQDPRPRRARLRGPGDQPCCSTAGAGADGLRALKWGPGQGP